MQVLPAAPSARAMVAMRGGSLPALILAVAGAAFLVAGRQAPSLSADVVVVGAGISGLSAALEAARGGASVTVVDMWSVFGGHAVMSEGGVSIVGTPAQQARGIDDTPDLAFRDFVTWGEDADTAWVRFYTDSSRAQLYSWLSAMGVTFDTLVQLPGNSVPRFHRTRGRGLGLVSPIYTECVRHPNVKFEWNVKVTGLVVERGRVSGVRGENLRTGGAIELRGRAVVLATGGFQTNLALVREFWPRNLHFPERILAGSGVNSVGSGLRIAQQAGAVLYNTDHQWNYVTGLVDPRHPGGWRGLNAQNRESIWVNAQGRRFVNEWAGNKVAFPALLDQRPTTYWAIFDDSTKRAFRIAGSDWGDFRTIQKLIFDDSALVKTAPSIEALAAAAGLPPSTLSETVRQYNAMVDRGEDTDFGRFGPGRASTPPQIARPPFYAVQFFPLTRKSMGGVRVDRSTRVLDERGRPIPGLYAVGELTGLAGINGRAGLEGTFLGPSIVTGRVAGRAAVAELKIPPRQVRAAVRVADRAPPAPDTASGTCTGCHSITRLVASPRPGYSHFEQVHRVVLSRSYKCTQCHGEMSPYRQTAHRIDRLAQPRTCTLCHVAVER